MLLKNFCFAFYLYIYIYVLVRILYNYSSFCADYILYILNPFKPAAIRQYLTSQFLHSIYFIPLNTLYFSALTDTRLVLISQHSLSTHSLSLHIYCFLFNTFHSSHPVLSLLKPIVAFPSSYIHLISLSSLLTIPTSMCLGESSCLSDFSHCVCFLFLSCVYPLWRGVGWVGGWGAGPDSEIQHFNLVTLSSGG